jgi:hypothetical protein
MLAFCEARPGLPTMIGRSTPSVADLGLVDPAQRIGIVLEIALNGVDAFELFHFVGRDMRHRGSLRCPDHRISIEVGITRLLLFRVLRRHDFSPAA